MQDTANQAQPDWALARTLDLSAVSRSVADGWLEWDPSVRPISATLRCTFSCSSLATRLERLPTLLELPPRGPFQGLTGLGAAFRRMLRCWASGAWAALRRLGASTESRKIHQAGLLQCRRFVGHGLHQGSSVALDFAGFGSKQVEPRSFGRS